MHFSRRNCHNDYSCRHFRRLLELGQGEGTDPPGLHAHDEQCRAKSCHLVEMTVTRFDRTAYGFSGLFGNAEDRLPTNAAGSRPGRRSASADCVRLPGFGELIAV